MTTPKVLRRMFSADGTESLKTALSTLRDAYLNADERLFGEHKDQVYYFLQPEKAAALRLPNYYGEAIRQGARIENYGVLLFCTGGAAPRPLFTLEEFGEFFPQAPQKTARFYDRRYFLDVDEAGERRLGRVLVDQDSSVENVIAKCQKAFEAAEAELPLFIEENRFSLAVVMAAAPKARNLEQMLRITPMGTPNEPIRVTVEVQDELLPMLMAREPKEPARGAA